MMSLEALILAAVLGTASSLNCQCSSEAGGVRCHKSWCHVKDSDGKVGACAFVRIGVRQHFACVRVKPTSKDSCRVSRRRNGEQQVRCWCRENYCNTDLADRVDEDHEEHENVAESAEKILTRTTTTADTMNDDFVIERNYDLKDEDYLNEYNDEALGNNNDDHPPTLPPTRTTAGATEQNPIMTTAIPPWRREYPVDRNQIQFNWLMPPPLSPLPTQPDAHKVLLQLAAETKQRIQEQYAQQRNHLRRTEYERKAQPITLSSSTRTTPITTITTMTTTSASPLVFSKEPPLANERSSHRREDNSMVFDRSLYDEHEARRRHEELLRKEQLMIVERARAQAAARSRLLKQDVTKPRAWLQVELMDARPVDNRRAPPVLTVRNYRPFDLKSIPSDAGERSTTTTETVIRHSTATSRTESQHDTQIGLVMNSSDAKGEEQNEKSTASTTTTPRTTITLTTATTEALQSSTSSDAMTEKISLNPTTSVVLPTTTTTATSTVQTMSIVRTTSESPTTTTTISTSTTTATTKIISKAHSNHQRVFIPVQNVTRAFRQKVTKSKLHDASIASSSAVFLAMTIVSVSFLS